MYNEEDVAELADALRAKNKKYKYPADIRFSGVPNLTGAQFRLVGRHVDGSEIGTNGPRYSDEHVNEHEQQDDEYDEDMDKKPPAKNVHKDQQGNHEEQSVALIPRMISVTREESVARMTNMEESVAVRPTIVVEPDESKLAAEQDDSEEDSDDIDDRKFAASDDRKLATAKHDNREENSVDREEDSDDRKLSASDDRKSAVAAKDDDSDENSDSYWEQFEVTLKVKPCEVKQEY
jgi:hypothetical protein